MKNAPAARSNESALNQRRFYTDNPRHCRALALLLQRPAKREELDARAGCSNAPDMVAELRRRGLDVPCERIEALDRDGNLCRPGVYHLTASDRRKVIRWMFSRSAGCISPELALMLVAVAPLFGVVFTIVSRWFL